MKKTKPRILSGFMELLPKDQLVFNWMFDTIRATYERFGFTPIETPAIELSEILLAKGGGETEKQIYRFMRGDTDLALHFDLTIPLARYVAEHYGDLVFPFRRYQMQKVWRAERAQKGRFREFYQCDIDVIGSLNPLIDAEIPSVIYSAFKALGLDDITIRINNRKLLAGFMDALDVRSKAMEILRAIDKIEKQGDSAVIEELVSLEITEKKAGQILEFTKMTGPNNEILSSMEALAISNDLFQKGLEELRTVSEAVKAFGVPEKSYKIDLTIARGLDYYTGTVYETILNKYPGIGSVCSGGRYDDLAQYYTDKELPGVGISIGLTRLFYQLCEAGMVSPNQSTPSKVLISHLGTGYLGRCLEIATSLREEGINTEVYFDSEKIGKQLQYANKLKIPFVLIVGENEVKSNSVTLKEMRTGEQRLVTLAETIKSVKSTF
ncbi:histidine--tRNA ligase [Candidatus Giovannonibacteria bacterium RIFCSPLOWO2_12_FULL_43_11c]|uniref:Histidine--tRNA ligase n=2 Tax=Parcubacteria group TaxID=1794811 RepID=A0A1F6W7P7_9BACT|nr:MAG: histidine--tRNA ligase [Candidatus Giovannonibacteria bacterium RIFCSPHIGHO2_12_FULL_43_15]OGF91759.1 MAG: histidine--tRNA ligase [Candidatus Giovannonibacteria bacterium RIFCSPLOWO2_12_FULL_43_11c]OGI77970.1 MAG: histidine--tRNA ligase [Candidatus Nomurabacteria bacterium RIFCSPHIGHO2_02_FULL_41_18]OGI90055.1 MAG: histidine--tRNA ligase [Candidatus Nomurabacteria bacterium RIFCSPLOWO2_01_FULL_41_52b]